ncbi:endonuclease NucS domain-containing protein [Nostoc sp. MS1]|uniref:endonuclease NucS domain-containing protein n=1 Tax=Nostoc sp. MS1 TaxID=2764711 RepID=UPI00398C79E9
MTGAALRKTSAGWDFASVAALEDFIWDNLQQLLGFTPLKRQYIVKNEVCDILALDEQQQLVILELKMLRMGKCGWLQSSNQCQVG